MPNILEQIVASTRKRVEHQKRTVPLSKLLETPTPTHPSFYEALKNQDFAYILEVKKASPTKGVIKEHFEPLEIAKQYEQAGAHAISVLSEPEFFLGKSEYVQQIAKTVSIPVLRKDFIIDPYMIYESAALGASAILLIASLLDEATLKSYLELTHRLGMDALVESRNEEDIAKALRAGAKIVGINNRDLRDFSVNIEQSLQLRDNIPPSTLFVCESGIDSKEQIDKLKQNYVDAVLIGEYMMRSDNKKEALERLEGKRL
ncbi:indole-3-glycerol phosphate synthase TrpC [Dubosiella newyorkensis]|uniref:indole-3-glycerol phosphate synthase TrpC n=1 Tax=Dubosiella newyorkensis TaxID=1862672 RepID=UPI00272FAFA0|nr:indole-3-glycerol phosphate synthase TrpC [Dubosiella newyorkensis]